MTDLDHVRTPALILDRAILQGNLARMAAIAAARGIALRPHLKTAKSLEVALLATGGKPAPITVSTLREAEQFASWGFSDIFYAVCLGPGKVSRAVNCVKNGAKLITCVDHPAAAAAVRAGADREEVLLRTLVEIDCGEGRGGVLPGTAAVIELAQQLGRHFAGVCTHGGHSYSARSPGERHAVAAAEASAVRQVSKQLAEANMPCAIVSVGSSPTALENVELAGITELRAGVYMFWDVFQAGNGQCLIKDVAVSVLAEVIGRPRGRDEFLVDAGAFALSKDLSTAALPAEKHAGFGLVCDLDGQPLPGFKVSRVWQEHGLVVSPVRLQDDMFPVGSRVRILPNHACPTAAAHDRYFVVDGKREIVAQWLRFTGW